MKKNNNKKNKKKNTRSVQYTEQAKNKTAVDALISFVFHIVPHK